MPRPPSRLWYLLSLAAVVAGLAAALWFVVDSAPDPIAEIETGVVQKVNLEADGITIFWREGDSGPDCGVEREGKRVRVTYAIPKRVEAADGTAWYALWESRDPMPPGTYSILCFDKPGRYAVGTYGPDPGPQAYASLISGFAVAIVAWSVVFALRRRRRN